MRVPVHGAELRERGLRFELVPCLYVGDDFEENFIRQIVCVCGHVQGLRAATQSRYPEAGYRVVEARSLKDGNDVC